MSEETGIKANMPIEITVPRLGWTMEEGTFVGWLKKDGEPVRAGEPLFTLDGDKALQEIEATDSGVLRISPDAPKPGSTVSVGALLGHLLVESRSENVGQASSLPGHGASSPRFSGGRMPPELADKMSALHFQTGSENEMPGSAKSGPAARVRAESLVPVSTPELSSSAAQLPEVARPFAGLERRAISPRALRKAMELGVDWTKLRGTGRGGRIRERDVVAATAKRTSPAQPGKVMITDWTFPDLAIEEAILKPIGHEVIARPCKNEAELIAHVADADDVITQFARVNANVINAMTKARAIVRYGIGVDNVDLQAARARGIPVCNVPDYCIDEVADQTLAFILGLTRQVVSHTNHVQSGRWGLAVPLSEMRTLRQLAVGVIGFGRIGREVVKRLLPFKCRVFVFDPVVPAGDITAAGAQAATLGEILATADILTLHCPSTPQTRKLISAEALAQMKRGALLVNVARGALVDTAALTEALQSGQLAGAALDVCDPEPIPAGHSLLKFPNVILAPHIASASPTAVKKLRETVATLAAAALRGELPPNVVNGITGPRTF